MAKLRNDNEEVSGDEDSEKDEGYEVAIKWLNNEQITHICISSVDQCSSKKGKNQQCAFS